MKSIFTLLSVCLLFTYTHAQTKRPAITPDRMLSFQCSLQNSKAVLAWSITDNEVYKYFEVEKSTNSKDFTTAGIVFTTENAGTENYLFKGATADSITYYRLKLVTKQDQFSYSKIIVLRIKSTPVKTNGINLLQNPVQNILPFRYRSTTADDYTITIYNTNGIQVYQTQANCMAGVNDFTLNIQTLQPGSHYILEVKNSNRRSTAFFLKQ